MKYVATITISSNTFTGAGSTRIAACADAFRNMLLAAELNTDPLPMTFELGSITIDREPTEREKKIMEETMRRLGKVAPVIEAPPAAEIITTEVEAAESNISATIPPGNYNVSDLTNQITTAISPGTKEIRSTCKRCGEELAEGESLARHLAGCVGQKVEVR